MALTVVKAVLEGMNGNTVVNPTLGEIIAQLRNAAGLSQDELALRIGMSGPWISKIETGKIRNPGLGNLAKIANAVGGDIDELARAAGHLPQVCPVQPTQFDRTMERVRRILSGPALDSIERYARLVEMEERAKMARPEQDDCGM